MFFSTITRFMYIKDISPSSALTLSLGVTKDFEHLSVDRVLSQGTHDIPTLAEADLPISCPVEQQECLLKLCRIHKHMTNYRTGMYYSRGEETSRHVWRNDMEIRSEMTKDETTEQDRWERK